MSSLTRRALLGAGTALAMIAMAAGAATAQDKIQLRMSTPASETDQRSVALATVFAPAVEAFASYEPH